MAKLRFLGEIQNLWEDFAEDKLYRRLLDIIRNN
jgi:hypothetical protein